MKFIVSGRNTEVTDVLKNRLTKKLGKLAKFFNPDTEVHSTFSTEKNKHIVEVTIPYNGVVYRAEEKNDDMFTSIDKVVDILEGQIRKTKTKSERKIRGFSAKGSLTSVTTKNEVERDKFRIQRLKKYSIKPMTVEEAIMQMNLEGDVFFVFSNVDTKQVNLVYKLKGGGYGLVEPEL